MGALMEPPDDLRAIERWILWRWVRKGDGLDKVPTRPSGDGNISPHEPSAWLSFDDAAERLRRALVNNTWGSGGGLGLAMHEDDDLGCVDLDGVRCPKTGRLAGWARDVVERFGSFTEVSPSGTGLHIYAFGAPEHFHPNSVPMERAAGDPVVPGKEPLCEVFVRGQFITVTGQRFDGAPDAVRTCPEVWAWLARQLGATTESPQPAQRNYDAVGLATVADAMSHFTSDDVERNTFVGFAHVLQERFGEEAGEMFRAWMAKSPNDDPNATARLWDGAASGLRAMTLASIFYHARLHGWTPSAHLLFDEVDAVEDEFLEYLTEVDGPRPVFDADDAVDDTFIEYEEDKE